MEDGFMVNYPLEQGILEWEEEISIFVAPLSEIWVLKPFSHVFHIPSKMEVLFNQNCARCIKKKGKKARIENKKNLIFFWPRCEKTEPEIA